MRQCHNVKLPEFLTGSCQVTCKQVRILNIDLSGSNCSADQRLGSSWNLNVNVKHNFRATGGRRHFEDPNFAFLTVRTIFE